MKLTICTISDSEKDIKEAFSFIQRIRGFSSLMDQVPTPEVVTTPEAPRLDRVQDLAKKFIANNSFPELKAITDKHGVTSLAKATPEQLTLIMQDIESSDSGIFKGAV